MTESGYYEVEGKYTRAASQYRDHKKAEKIVNTIWKYELTITDRQTIQMPKNAEILSVGLQGKVVSVGLQGKTTCLWALVNPDNDMESRIIEIHGTGNPISNKGLPIRKYIGSAITDTLVWHIFEATE